MLFTPSAAYAVKALLFLASQPQNSRWMASTVSDAMGIPGPTLSKVLGALKTRGLVSSVRGPGGGYVLSRKPETISLMEIARLFDPEGNNHECELMLGTCGSCDACPLHGLWEPARDAVRRFMEQTTVDTLARRAPTATPAPIHKER